MREVKGSGPTSPSMLNITFLNFTINVDSFYVNPNYVDYCIDPYYVTGEPPEDAAPLHHRIPTPQPLKQLKL